MAFCMHASIREHLRKSQENNGRFVLVLGLGLASAFVMGMDLVRAVLLAGWRMTLFFFQLSLGDGWARFCL